MFVAASAMVQEVMYICRFVETLGFPQKMPTVIYEDKRTCIAWLEGSVGECDRTKHIDLLEHFVHDAVNACHCCGTSRWLPELCQCVADLLTNFRLSHWVLLCSLHCARH